jgi:hypothetical protein
MRLRRNQICPIHRSLSCCGREATQRREHHGSWAFGESRMLSIPEDTGNSVRMRKCGNCSIGRSSPRAVIVASAAPRSQIAVTSFLTISARGAWEGHGEMITRKTFRPFTCGATARGDL